ncbi:PntA NAD/NADP transhydrogenase alpha subunit [Candidatus Methylopumilus planktonicus]|uniref:Re/Si-specific NAD(P)(+) transhydrogenase subunit alpha n=1 Tax=Candidatus Methylopumilus planktonicus TaxID=1581557 RepID=UPI003BEF313E
MKIGVLKEIADGESRIAITPDIVKKLIQMKCEVFIEKDAGIKADISNQDFINEGAIIVSKSKVIDTEIILKVRAPSPDEIKSLKEDTIIIGLLEPFNYPLKEIMANQGLTCFALEALPRNSRAQSMDALSSQANISGYKSVLLATQFYKKFMPMLMTAAGTVKAARVLILGAGVAGLQAIATAKRLGAIVEASDVRPAVKEQIESLGAKFIDVPFETKEEKNIASGQGGYAQKMPAAWLKRQTRVVSEHAMRADIVITSALIPGMSPPELISKDTVEGMKQGSVIIDLAAGTGQGGCGNCPLTQADQVIEHKGVTIVGYTNLPSLVSHDASVLFAKNVYEFFKLLINSDGQLEINYDDELLSASLMTREGKLFNERKVNI